MSSNSRPDAALPWPGSLWPVVDVAIAIAVVVIVGIPPLGLGGHVVADRTAAGRAQQGMVTGNVTGYPADDSPFQAAFGICRR